MSKNKKKEIILIGAGLHGKVVLDVCKDAGLKVKGFVDDVKPLNTTIANTKLLGRFKDIEKNGLYKKYDFAITIGSNYARENYAAKILKQGGKLATIIHPSCYISDTCSIGYGTVIVGGNYLYSESKIGNNVLLDPDSTIGAKSIVDDCVYISPGVHIASEVKIGKSSFIGIGAVVTPQIHIGVNAIVGAGSVVIRDVRKQTMVIGNPAKFKKKSKIDKKGLYPARKK